ncbi:uncharacterized protein LOC144158366 isoform X2 [Haemaphysalis longicornis]
MPPDLFTPGNGRTRKDSRGPRQMDNSQRPLARTFKFTMAFPAMIFRYLMVTMILFVALMAQVVVANGCLGRECSLEKDDCCDMFFCTPTFSEEVGICRAF